MMNRNGVNGVNSYKDDLDQSLWKKTGKSHISSQE